MNSTRKLKKILHPDVVFRLVPPQQLAFRLFYKALYIYHSIHTPNQYLNIIYFHRIYEIPKNTNSIFKQQKVRITINSYHMVVLIPHNDFTIWLYLTPFTILLLLRRMYKPKYLYQDVDKSFPLLKAR